MKDVQTTTPSRTMDGEETEGKKLFETQSLNKIYMLVDTVTMSLKEIWDVAQRGQSL